MLLNRKILQNTSRNGRTDKNLRFKCQKAVKQAGLVKRVDCAVFTLTADYSSYEKIKRLLDECVVMDTGSELVTVRFAVEDLKAEERIGRMNELLNNRCVIEQKRIICLGDDMAGHSKWANIKHKKEKSDAARGKIFTKIGREIMVAVKAEDDPASNSRLRDVIAKAKANNNA